MKNKMRPRIAYLFVIFLFCGGIEKGNGDSVNSGRTSYRLLIGLEEMSVQCGGRCDVESVANVEIAIEERSISREEIDCFLYSFDKSCRVNTEYSEFSNEVLFLVLDKHADLVLCSMVENNQLKREYIYKVLSAPVNDRVNIETLIKKIDNVESEGFIKEKILAALSIALERYK